MKSSLLPMSFNDAQKRAIEHVDGPMIGTGRSGIRENDSHYPESEVFDRDSRGRTVRHSCRYIYKSGGIGDEKPFFEIDQTKISAGQFRHISCRLFYQF